jgi:hypothetical protein
MIAPIITPIEQLSTANHESLPEKCTESYVYKEGALGFTVKEYPPQRHSPCGIAARYSTGQEFTESSEYFLIKNSFLRDLSASAVKYPNSFSHRVHRQLARSSNPRLETQNLAGSAVCHRESGRSKKLRGRATFQKTEKLPVPLSRSQ